MNAAAKIRWLLALICLSLFITAIVARKTYSPDNNLQSSAKTLEEHLNRKEQYVYKLVNDYNNFASLKNINNDEKYPLKLIGVVKDEKIYIATYNRNELTYWNGIRVLPDNAADIKNGSSFIKEANGYYEAIKKTQGDFSVIFFIPVKNDYAYQNAYLQNIFSPDLLQDDNLALGRMGDKNSYDIYSTDHHYLFTVKLVPNDLNHFFSAVIILLWLSGLLLLCALTNNLAQRVATKGYVFISFSIIALVICTVRFVNLYYSWPSIYSEISLFNPTYYRFSAVFPSLGDFVINVLLLSWLTLFVYNNRAKIIKKPIAGTWPSYAVCIGSVLFLITLSTLMVNLFRSLIYNSKINFDVNNVLNLSSFSIVGILMLCLGFFMFILYIETGLYISTKLNLSHIAKLVVFMSLIFLATVYEIIQKDFSDYYLLWSLLVIIRGYAVYYDRGKFSALTYIGMIIICASVSSVKLYVFQSSKENDNRQKIALKLEADSDPVAEKLFKPIENQIEGDSLLAEYFEHSLPNNGYLRNRFQKLYFDGYFSQYDLKVYDYGANDKPLSGVDKFDVKVFREMVMYSAIQVGHTQYFYQSNSDFGFKSYFAIVPIRKGQNLLGTIVVDLKSKPFTSIEPFPELLTEASPENRDDLKGYSYAFYTDGKLRNQSGKYVYSLANFEFSGKLNKFLYNTSIGDGTTDNKTRYSHLVYQPSERKLLVITKEDDMFFSGITSLTFFFLIFLVFALIVLGVSYVWKNYKTMFQVKSIKWSFWQNFDKVLYKTRIQLSMVFSVVITLFIIGMLTFFSVRNQYINQQDETIRDKMARISVAFQNLNIFDKLGTGSVESAQLDFNSFANTYTADLTLFDTTGRKLLTTQPKLYDAGLVEPVMNATAFVYLKRLKKSGFINNEVIGTLDYKAAYAPIRDINNSVIGFLQLPYFANEADYRERIGAFLNTMINVYALVLVAIGLFAVVVARQITTPLTLIQESLSNTIYGRKNEPIKWHHNDEIGSLIKEYNKMISALENSASKLAQSERENAWREMAKQVAHEIKNPLTPLKLGLQLLEKAWRDKDARFDQKFERFTKSFVEQIDSLSRIASEFSSFAKMPETHMERFDIFEVINRTTTIFKQTDNLEINYNPPGQPFIILADKDQILRSFNNLLKNAIEAIPAERHGMIEITYTVNPSEILLQVKDNGSGIPVAMRESIFVPNFTTKSSGTGLGLALVKNALEYASGSISFDTELGVGTVFYIRLPAAKAV